MKKMIYLEDAINAVDYACEELRGVFGRCEEKLLALPSAQPEITDEQAIEHLQSTGWMQKHDRILTESAQPTLYGYKIEHLAYIAKVMQEEGVTAEYAVRTFDNMSRALRMIIEEVQQKVEEALNG